MCRVFGVFLVALGSALSVAGEETGGKETSGPATQSELDAVLAEVEALAGVAPAVTNALGGLDAVGVDVVGVDEVETNAIPTFEFVYQEMKGAVTEEVGRRWKSVEVGDYVELRRPDGIIPKGLVDEIVSNVVVVKNGEFVTRMNFGDLNVWDRLRFDPKFRDQWVDEHARMKSRLHLMALGKVFEKPDLSKGGGTDRALDFADPEALLLVAQEFKKLGRRDADFAYAFLYYKLAAEMREGEGLFNLGIMYLHGIGVPSDARRGLAFISMAQKEGNRDAEHFLTRYREKVEIARAAAEELERERIEEQKRYEAYEARVRAEGSRVRVKPQQIRRMPSRFKKK